MPPIDHKNDARPMTVETFRAALREQASEILRVRGMGKFKAGPRRRKRPQKPPPKVGLIGAAMGAPQTTAKVQSVYVVGWEDGPVKIGIAFNVHSRLKELQTGSPHKLQVYFAIEVPDGRAREVEKAAHGRLKIHRLSGEWFSVDHRKAIDAVRDCCGGAKARETV